MKNLDLQKITLANIKLILINHPAKTATVSYDVVYEDQVPTCCFILIEGKIEIVKNKHIIGEVPANSIVGLNQILKHEPVSYTYRVIEGSELVYFDRTTLKAICNEKNSKVGDSLRALIS